MSSASDQPRPGGPSPDEAGFREWVSLRAPGLRRRAYLLCGDWHAADDLVQDALISLYTTWPRVARGNNVDAYASRVLVHKLIDEKRRPWRQQHVTEAVPERTDPKAREAFESVERRDGPLAAALATLPGQQRAVLVLRYIDDLAVDDIARVLDLPAGTVKSRLSRGIDALRIQLETSGYTDASATSHAPSHATEGMS
ncbi:MAG: RNA polymerase sigma factor [Dehalococcoidia bacterium]